MRMRVRRQGAPGRDDRDQAALPALRWHRHHRRHPGRRSVARQHLQHTPQDHHHRHRRPRPQPHQRTRSEWLSIMSRGDNYLLTLNERLFAYFLISLRSFFMSIHSLDHGLYSFIHALIA